MASINHYQTINDIPASKGKDVLLKILNSPKAALKLMCELQKGRISGEENGWLSEEDVEKHLKEKFNA